MNSVNSDIYLSIVGQKPIQTTKFTIRSNETNIMGTVFPLLWLAQWSMTLWRNRQIQKISPGAYIFQRPFWGGGGGLYYLFICINS